MYESKLYDFLLIFRGVSASLQGGGKHLTHSHLAVLSVIDWFFIKFRLRKVTKNLNIITFF
jgi:hypothetical protein